MFPMARAGHTFQQRSMRGKFQGTMAPTTPTAFQPAYRNEFKSVNTHGRSWQDLVRCNKNLQYLTVFTVFCRNLAKILDQYCKIIPDMYPKIFARHGKILPKNVIRSCQDIAGVFQDLAKMSPRSHKILSRYFTCTYICCDIAKILLRSSILLYMNLQDLDNT